MIILGKDKAKLNNQKEKKYTYVIILFKWNKQTNKNKYRKFSSTNSHFQILLKHTQCFEFDSH